MLFFGAYDSYILFLCVSFLLMTSIRGYLNLYHTDRYNDPTSLQYDCLDYYVDDNIVSYKVIYDALAHQLIAYCIRLDDQYKKPKKIVANISIHGYNYTFLYLKNESITGQQLLSWTATIELVERYEAYLMSDSTAGDHELYYNCTKNWFGNTCEYSFNEMKSIETLQTVVHEHFSMKDWAPLEHISCYTLLEVGLTNFSLLTKEVASVSTSYILIQFRLQSNSEPDIYAFTSK